jgi:hypothetical protein
LAIAWRDCAPRERGKEAMKAGRLGLARQGQRREADQEGVDSRP